MIEAAGPRCAEECLQFRERLFDRVEIWTVRRKKPQVGADVLNRGADLRLSVHRQVIEDHDVAAAECGRQNLFDVGEEAGVVDRPVEHRWCRESFQP